MKKMPTLAQLKDFIVKHDLYGNWGLWGKAWQNSEERFFQGNCHYASVALSEYLMESRRLVVRGWYTDVAMLANEDGWIRNNDGHIGHSWIVYNGKIIDPTWWAFYPHKEEGAIYQHDKSDPRYHTRGEGL